MNKDLIIAILALAFFGSTAAFFVMWSKMEEWKQKAKDEQDNYRAALRLANTNAESAQEMAQGIEGLQMGVRYLAEQNEALQEFKSSTLCPRNDHIWEYGVCKRCGKVQE